MSNIISLGKQRVILKLTNAVRNAKETNSDVVWFKRKPSILPQLSNVIQCLHTICFARIETHMASHPPTSIRRGKHSAITLGLGMEHRQISWFTTFLLKATFWLPFFIQPHFSLKSSFQDPESPHMLAQKHATTSWLT